jgi:hypothetical protein
VEALVLGLNDARARGRRILSVVLILLGLVSSVVGWLFAFCSVTRA